MKKIILLFILYCSKSMIYGQTHTHFIKGQTIICGAGQFQHQTFVPPPPKNFGSHRFGRTEQNVLFDVNYENFPENAQNAVQYALDIWASLLRSDVPIRVNAIWDSTNLNNSSLGGGRAITFQLDFEGAPRQNTWYATALAEKLARQQLNDSQQVEVEISFNAHADWYYKTDGNVPSDKYDLVTTALHEIAHGIGISAFSRVEENIGNWGRGTQIPSIYDRFLSDENHQLLVENFPNNSEIYAQKLTENNLFFQSQSTQNQDNTFPKLHAPTPYVQGSSVSHLNVETYPVGSANSLMIPQISKGIALHHPGDVILNMLAEMGWVATFLTHQPPENLEVSLEGYPLKLELESDHTFDANSITLHYSSDNFFNSRTVKMTSVDGKIFTGKLPYSPENLAFQYYFTASDPLRSYRLPSNYENYTLQIIDDNEPPIIQHQPIFSVALNLENIPFLAQISDVSGIQSAQLEYAINGELQPKIPLQLQQNGNYLATISTAQLTENDTIMYRFRAVDNSSQSYENFLPMQGYFMLLIEAKRQAVLSYESNFDDRPDDFIGTGFSIRTASGFSTPAIHSVHPYETAKEYFFQLKTPIIVKNEQAYLQFDEVVLVEKGSPNSVFGAEDFWDFVVVEGSENNGETWQFLTPPYDSRFHQVWADEYDNFTNDLGESFAQGHEKLFVQKTVNLHDTFEKGKEIWIRFRLVSDAELTAWGWAIDHLKIQTDDLEITALEKSEREISQMIRIFPNPTTGKFAWLYNSDKLNQNLRIEVYTILGKKVWENDFQNSKPSFVKSWDLSNFPKGIYVINFWIGAQKFSKKLILY